MRIYNSPKGRLNIYRQIVEIEGIGSIVFYWANQQDTTKLPYRFLSQYHYDKEIKDGKAEIVGQTEFQFIFWDKDYIAPDGREVKAPSIEFVY